MQIFQYKNIIKKSRMKSKKAAPAEKNRDSLKADMNCSVT